MTTRIRFLRPDTGVLIGDVFVSKASVNTGLGKTGEWSTEIPLAIDILDYLEKGQTAQIFHQGKLVIEGQVKTFQPKFGDENTIEIKGRDFLDGLYDYPADTSAVYKDALLVQAVASLLITAGWRLGDISTMINPLTTKITGDFRSEERLLPQIQKLINSVPKLTYRYGGIQAGYPTLDIGFFATSSGIRFYSPPNDDSIVNAGDGTLDVDDTIGFIRELSYETTLEDLTWGIEAYGGEVTDELGIKRNISLYDALRADTTRVNDPDYPIMEYHYGPRGRYITWDIDKQPGLGGVLIDYTGANNASLTFLGNPSPSVANVNYRCGVFFKSPGGYLQDLIVQFGSTSQGSITDEVMWWLYDNDGVFPTPGTLLASGSMGAWVSGKWVRSQMPNNIKEMYLPKGEEYSMIFSYDKPGGYPLSTSRSIAHNNASSATTMMRGVTFTGATGVWAHSLTFNPNMELTFLPPAAKPSGAVIVKTMTQFAPEQTEVNATAADCQKAGTALWEWCKRFIADHVENQVKYNLTPVGEVAFPTIGDTIEVHGIAQGTIIDPYTERVETVTTKVDKNNLRVDSLGLEFGSDKVEMKFELTEGDGITNLDFFVTIYDSAKDDRPLQGIVRTWFTTWQTVSATHTQGNADPDTTLADGRPAKLVTLPLPVSPGGVASKVYLEFTPLATDLDDNSMAAVEMVTYPSEDGTGAAVIKVCTGLAWKYTSSVEFDINYVWY